MTSPAGENEPQANELAPVPAPVPIPPAVIPPAVVSRPKLLAFLIVVFALWIALLLLIYFTTVYPMRHPGGG